MRILIAYDGSAGAKQSLRLADSIHWPPDSTLLIATVIEPTLLFVGAPMAGGFDIPSPEVDAQITAYQQEQVTEAARSLRSADRTVEGIVLRGRPATALLGEATRLARIWRWADHAATARSRAFSWDLSRPRWSITLRVRSSFRAHRRSIA